MRLLEAILEANHRADAGDERAGLHLTEFADSLPIIALTCIDPRLNPLMPEVLGIPEEHFIWLRNAGNVITGPLSSTMRSLALACAVKGGREIVIIGHTDCLIGKTSMMTLTERFKNLGIERARLPENLTEYFGLFASERQNVLTAVGHVRSSPLIGPQVPVHGLLVDIRSGRLEWVVNGYQVLGTAASASPSVAASPSTSPSPSPGPGIPSLDALNQMLPFQLGEMRFPEGKIGELATQAGNVLGRIEQVASRAEHLPGKVGEFAEKVGHLADRAAGWLNEVQVHPQEDKAPPPLKDPKLKLSPHKPIKVPPPVPLRHPPAPKGKTQ